MNRNFNNQAIINDETLSLIQNNQSVFLQTANTFTKKQTFDEIAMSKITLSPIGGTVMIGSSSAYTLSNGTSIGMTATAGSNGVSIGYGSQGFKTNNIIVGAYSTCNAVSCIVIGNTTGHSSPASLNNIYLGHYVSHMLNAAYSNSVAIGNSVIISANDTVYVGTANQFQQLSHPIMTNPPILNYTAYPTLLSTQIGFIRSSTITAVFSSTLDLYQNLSSIILPIGCYSIVYQLSIIPNTITTGIDKFLCNVSLADTITNTIPFQTNLIPCRMDNASLNINFNTNYSNSLVVTNNTLLDKSYFLNMMFITSEMVGINPNKYTYTIKIDATRLS